MSARWAVSAGTPSAAPTSRPASSGSGTARSAGTTVYSAAVPVGRPAAAMYDQTR
ncbi:hypothetical protein LUX33_31930 [Actinomadura madurae]|uniref:hypothetical protein n=1 Tax=Actinomadura madurae TaxID=1993 RepID=UPI0020D21F0F|nr:hypothetical protein [Actinomadura madurae]MCP9952589.1 hypothetical protein [Actinomadura madurae]